MGKFKVLDKDSSSKARVGLLQTRKGSVITPLFMPVATLGSVKALSNDVLKSIGVTTLMCNTYHMLVRPGLNIIKKTGGLHNFINWDSVIFTDSGGFQIFSLSNFVKVKEGYIEYADHITGNKFNLSAKDVVTIQEDVLESDMFVHLDYPSFYPTTKEDAEINLNITIEWAKQGLNVYKGKGMLFGINQGATYPDLRLKSLDFVLSHNFDGIAIGGLGLGEPPEKTIDVIKLISDNVRVEKPLYAMGLGRPEDIVDMIEHGVDVFDCVLPTRSGRFGRAYTYDGIMILKNNKYMDDFTPIDSNCQCFACRNYSRAFLRHLILSDEIVGVTMVSLHNVYFYIDMFEKIKNAILQKRFMEWKKEFLGKYLKIT